MHEINIELLREEAQRLLNVEINFLEKMLEEPGVITKAKKEQTQTFDIDSTKKQIGVFQGELHKLETLDMVLAVVGTMKAGKSTTINAIVGTEVLPNRNRPMTALPTLIRHTPGQTEPLLKFENCQPINDLISDLHKIIKNPKSSEALQSLDSNQDMNELMLLVKNKTSFKPLYSGSEEIFWFLKSLNDLVRLSHELNVDFPFASYDEMHEMPLIEVEFAHLREMSKAKGKLNLSPIIDMFSKTGEMNQPQGRLTLLDTPGPNESGQPHLRKMLQEQMGKASAVLAVLDYTQLKSDADTEVRKELEKIASITEGRLYTLVNKFDEKNRHGDNEEQTQTFVAEELMQGLIQKTDVYPVSSNWAYLANRAKSELFLHKKLPDPSKQRWVADFAEAALGRRWESKGIEEIQQAADDLWEDSLFSKPLENIIKTAHARAAAFAIDSAAAKLVDNAENMERFLGLREKALVKSAKDLQTLIDALLTDIDNVNNAENRTQKRINETLDSVTKSTKDAFEAIKKEAVEALKKYFREGKRLEKAQHVKKEEEEEKKKEKQQGTIRILKAIFSQESPKPSSNTESDFDPQNPIMKFDNPDDAKTLIERIKESVESIMKNADDDMKKTISASLEVFHENFTKTIARDAKEIVDAMKNRMADVGFSINLKIPDTKGISLVFSADEILENIISEETATKIGRRRTNGLWGKICRICNSDDWGYEDFKYSEQHFEIDINKVKSSIIKGINNTFSRLEKSVATSIQGPLNSQITKFFNDLKSTMEQIRGDLMQSIDDQKHSKSEQDGLAKRLAALKKNIPQIQKDSCGLKADVQPLLSSNTQVCV